MKIFAPASRFPGSQWIWLAGAGLFTLLALCLIMALLGFQAADPSWREGNTKPVMHYLGWPGAFLASLCYGAFGLSAWWLVLFFIMASLVCALLRSDKHLLLLFSGGVWLLPVLAACLGLSSSVALLGGGEVLWGGEAGQALSETVAPQLGFWGIWLVLGCGLLLGTVIIVLAIWPLIPPLFRFLRVTEVAREQDNAPLSEVDLSLKPLPPLWLRSASKNLPAEANPPSPVPYSETKLTESAPPSVPISLGRTPSVSGEESAVIKEAAPPQEAETEDGPRILPRFSREEENAASLSPLASGPGRASSAEVASAAEYAELYELPPLDLLLPPDSPPVASQTALLQENSRRLEQKLADFGVQGQVVEVAPGPVVTMYEFKPAPGVKISRVAGLADDLAMNLKAASIRIVAPIPGKSVIGIEIPSMTREKVFLRELLGSTTYQRASSPMTVALGKDILGRPVVDDLTRMPHLLIAGATGAGKSVFINTLVLSILYKSTPQQVRLLMVDPKRIELSNYNDIPHLLYPIITAPKDASAGLRWAVREMERRYELLAELGVKNIRSFNDKLLREGLAAGSGQGLGGENTDSEHPGRLSPLPYILIIIDELADLMMLASKEVEALITRLAQMARAAGIHLVLATQRPSVDVITGLIKANFPARLSFQVSSRVDSRTILDTQGAEHLLGAGDMLFLPPGTSTLQRLHGAYVSEAEIDAVVAFCKKQGRPSYDQSIVSGDEQDAEVGDDFESDECYAMAVAVVKESGKASISYVQRRLRVGYNRAARMIEQMEQDGIVGPSDGSRPREVLIRE